MRHSPGDTIIALAALAGFIMVLTGDKSGLLLIALAIVWFVLVPPDKPS
jgi:hypothetical protein